MDVLDDIQDKEFLNRYSKKRLINLCRIIYLGDEFSSFLNSDGFVPEDCDFNFNFTVFHNNNKHKFEGISFSRLRSLAVYKIEEFHNQIKDTALGKFIHLNALDDKLSHYKKYKYDQNILMTNVFKNSILPILQTVKVYRTEVFIITTDLWEMNIDLPATINIDIDYLKRQKYELNKDKSDLLQQIRNYWNTREPNFLEDNPFDDFKTRYLEINRALIESIDNLSRLTNTENKISGENISDFKELLSSIRLGLTKLKVLFDEYK